MEKKTLSPLIRTAIDERYVCRSAPANFGAALDEAFGLWRGRKKSSVAMVRALRRGNRLKNLADCRCRPPEKKAKE